MSRRVFVLPRCENVVDRALTDVYQHVCVCESLHGTDLVPLHRRYHTVVHLTAEVFFEDLPISDGCYAVVVELEPPCLAIRLDQGEVVSAMEVARVHEHAVQLVHPGVCPVRSLVEELAQVNFEGELVAIIDLGSE